MCLCHPESKLLKLVNPEENYYHASKNQIPLEYCTINAVKSCVHSVQLQPSKKVYIIMVTLSLGTKLVPGTIKILSNEQKDALLFRFAFCMQTYIAHYVSCSHQAKTQRHMLVHFHTLQIDIARGFAFHWSILRTYETS